MTRFTKSANGSYNVNGHNYEILTGSRAQVWHGTACKTSGGLKKSDLMQNKAGRIVSRSKHNTAKKDNRLVKSGYGTKKGTFGFVKLGVSRGKSSRKSRKGGSGLSALSPASYDGKGEGTSGAGLQIYATTIGGGPSRYSRQFGNSKGGSRSSEQWNNTAGRNRRGGSRSSEQWNNTAGRNRRGGSRSSQQWNNTAGRNRRGGMYALSPSPYAGEGVTSSGNAPQFAAGNA